MIGERRGVWECHLGVRGGAGGKGGMFVMLRGE